MIGTSDGSYSFIAPSDGDEALERRLTDLLESTSGLVGKSVFIDLNVGGESNRAAFLGDFFGQTVKSIVLHAFMQVTIRSFVQNLTVFEMPGTNLLCLK